MDCGIPFCHAACPLGNLIPEWNDLLWRDQLADASNRLHATNNFPEFTGRVCPAPCESACVLSINQGATTIRNIESSIVEAAFEAGLVQPLPPARLTGSTVAVVGSGPAGLAAAQQLTRAGHTVVVYEKDARIGGLLRYGIPDFKLDKAVIDRRLAQLEAEGTRLRPGTNIGVDITWDALRRRFDAVVVAVGAGVPRVLPIPGYSLKGIHTAMEFLRPMNDMMAGEPTQAGVPHAGGKHVVVLGGGDTGSDCVGTALRQGAASVTSLTIEPRPPSERSAGQPWPTDPVLFKVSTSHEEGGTREYAAATMEFLGDADGAVVGLRVADTNTAGGSFAPTPGTERFVRADMVLLAVGYTGPDVTALTEQIAVAVAPGGTVQRSENFASSVPGVFVAGDAGRGQSLVVWAIAEGRACAAAVDRFLRGTTELPAPIEPTTRALAP
jgi:glutamate synthase (NADPH/NADH) small chain